MTFEASSGALDLVPNGTIPQGGDDDNLQIKDFRQGDAVEVAGQSGDTLSVNIVDGGATELRLCRCRE